MTALDRDARGPNDGMLRWDVTCADWLAFAGATVDAGNLTSCRVMNMVIARLSVSCDLRQVQALFAIKLCVTQLRLRYTTTSRWAGFKRTVCCFSRSATNVK